MSRSPEKGIYLRLMARTLAPRRGENRVTGTLWAFALFLILLGVWQFWVKFFNIPDIILPSPSDIIEYLIRRDKLFVTHLWPTLLQTLWGFALAVTGGIMLAVIVALTDFGRRAVMPLLVVAQIVPKIAIAPLFMLWFGLGDLSRVLIAFLVAFFPIVINTVSGLSSVDENVVLLGRAFARSRWKFFLKIQFPHALPYIFDGMKVAITLAIIGVIVAEFVSSQRGLGSLIMFGNGRLDTVMMMAAIVVLSVMGLALYGLIALLARVVVYWREGGRGLTQ
jgi:NitT/TauT family transport system permease protein